MAGHRPPSGSSQSGPGSRRFFSLYFLAAAFLAVLAVLSQFELRPPSRAVAPLGAIRGLAGRNAREGDLSVVFLLIDTLRADRLGIYGYARDTSPNIDALARRGIVFEDVVSQSTWTKTSMASLWTGTHPANHGVLRYDHAIPEAAVLPAEIFREAGYRTVGIWRNGWVEPNFGFAQGFDTYVRPTPGAERLRAHRDAQNPNPLSGTDEDLTLAALDFLARFGRERFFLYLHYMDVHQYVYDERSAVFGTSYADAYDQSVLWVDGLVGALVSGLEREGVLDRTLIVIASDHGEAFLEHGFEGHARDLYRETTHVPWILLPPMLLDPGVRVSRTVSNADVWPTILDLVGLPPLPGADGRSLVPLVLHAGGLEVDVADDLARPVLAQIQRGWGNTQGSGFSIVSLTSADRRLIVRYEDPPVAELYDRVADPHEQRDLSATRPREAEALRLLVDRYRSLARPPWRAPPGEVALDEMRLNQLRALGYVIER